MPARSRLTGREKSAVRRHSCEETAAEEYRRAYDYVAGKAAEAGVSI